MLLSDQQFKRLSLPISAEELQELENDLLQNGCHDPIYVWHGFVVDGYKRYEICERNRITYEIQECDFETYEDAVLWLCRQKRQTTRPGCVAARYLNGKLCNTRQAKSEVEVEGHTEKSLISESQLAREEEISPRTLRRCRDFAKNLDLIADKLMSLFDAIMTEQVTITYEEAAALAKKSKFQLQRFCKLKGVVLDTSERITKSQGHLIPLKIGIKKMPEYDPDAELRGLVLTVPAWVNAIERVHASVEAGRGTVEMKEQLIMTLSAVDYKVNELMEVLKNDG